MHRNSKINIGILLSVIIILFSTSHWIKAENSPPKLYIALGDSISYGMDAGPGKGYVDLFYSYLKTLKKYRGIELKNLSHTGDTSTDLLKKINSNEDILKKADVITISIGGNNIIYPVITSAGKLFNLDYNESNFVDKLLTAIEKDPNGGLKLLGLVLSQDFYDNLEKWTSAFSSDWTTIIEKVRALAPGADIYVTTVFNPFNESDPLFTLFDTQLQKINKIIKTSGTSYKVVDVYDEFNKNNYCPSVSSTMATSLLGIHPDNKGHQIIYEAHRKLAAIPVESISLENPPKDLALGSTSKLDYIVYPSNAAYTDILWTSSSSEVASVDGEGNINAVSPGTAVIKAMVKGTNKEASCTINVIVPVESISLDKTSEKIAVNSELQLTASVFPANATLKDIVWLSDNEEIASVDTNGRVRGLKPGKALITAASKDGSKTALCSIDVIVPVENISIDKTSEKIHVGGELQLKASTYPSDASIKDVVWKSSDENVASVDESGKVKGLKEGSAEITAVSADGNKTAACSVTVTPKKSGLPFNYGIMISITGALLVSGVILKKRKISRSKR